ncbi:MAG: phosphatase RsbU N-terminal domain-containing protein [Jatrophihabitantaceae bacterium]
MTVTQELERNYRVAFLRYLPRREEEPLRVAYEIGRSAVIQGITILDLAELHHEVLLEVLQDTPRTELAEVTAGASEFFREVLATFDMTQRSLLEQQRPPTATKP